MLRRVLPVLLVLGLLGAPPASGMPVPRGTGGYHHHSKELVINVLRNHGWNVNLTAKLVGRSWGYVKRAADSWAAYGSTLSLFELGYGTTGRPPKRSLDTDLFVATYVTLHNETTAQEICDWLFAIVGVQVVASTMRNWLHDLGYAAHGRGWVVRGNDS